MCADDPRLAILTHFACDRSLVALATTAVLVGREVGVEGGASLVTLLAPQPQLCVEVEKGRIKNHKPETNHPTSSFMLGRYQHMGLTTAVELQQ